MVALTNNQYYRILNYLRNAREWVDQGHPEAVDSYIAEAEIILGYEKDSALTESDQTHTDSIHDLAW